LLANGAEWVDHSMGHTCNNLSHCTTPAPLSPSLVGGFLSGHTFIWFGQHHIGPSHFDSNYAASYRMTSCWLSPFLDSRIGDASNGWLPGLAFLLLELVRD
jgi:hypothetical protein